MSQPQEQVNQTLEQAEPVAAPQGTEPASSPETSTPSGFGLLSGVDSAENDNTLKNSDSPSSDWVNLFSEDNRTKPYLKEFKSADDLLKSYENQRSLIGKRLEDFTPEQLESYRSKLGVPDKPDAYKLTLPEEMSKEGLNEEWFRTTMQESNIPQKEANKLYGKYAELVNSQMKEMKASREKALADGMQELDKVYGTAKGQRIAGIVNFVRETGGDEILEAFNNSDLAANPKFVQFLGRMAELSAEDKGVALTQSKSWGTTPSEAQAQIANMKSDPDFLNKVSNDKQFKETWMKLHTLAYPE